MAGDFNSNLMWDKPRSENHKNLVEKLAQLGLESVFHSRLRVSQGKEIKHHTFLRYWKKAQKTHEQWSNGETFHIDYIFVPQEWLSRIDHFEIGDCTRWGVHSDHLPLLASFKGAE